MFKILCLQFIFIVSLFSQELNFNFDYAQFRYDSTKNYLEIYYSLNSSSKDSLNSSRTDSFFLNVKIQNRDSSKYLINKSWVFSQESFNKELDKNVLVGNLGFLLNAGNYNLIISLKDDKNKIIKELSEQIEIEPYFDTGTAISDIQLAGNIIVNSENKTSMFYKNSFEVIPRPNQFFHIGHPIVYFYSELYGLNQDSLIFKQSIVNNKNKILITKEKFLLKKYESRVEVGYFNIKDLPTGSYIINLALFDNKNNIISKQTKKFYYYNNTSQAHKDFSTSTNPYVNSEFGVLSKEECDDMFEKSKILSTHLELEQYKKLDSLNQKRSFLYEFWKKRDNDKSTEINEFKKIFFERIDYANQKYRTLTKKGFETDRGRIYVKYGEPDEIERFPNEVNSKPYEIWKYNQIEGSVIFIFGDITGFNFYELLHSTKRGELHDPYWQKRISVQ
ncbi:MAG: hypothetical protein CR986_00965 [Ignavibacteriae bacterium]|nr:MAG: hypothetical protein CR986_00965 [Ignavibacteriota bacterium]